MRQKEFVDLSIDEQAQYVWQHGRYLMGLEEMGFMATLYAVDTFFVEIWYNAKKYSSHPHAVAGVYAFRNLDHLFPYLKRISLADLDG